MIIVGIASIPGREKSLELVLDSLVGQVDHINLVLNGHEKAPEFLHRYNNVWSLIKDNSRGDAMKFAMADGPQCYYFSCDDDLIYPEHYVQYMIRKCDEYKCIVTLHGKRYDGERPVKSFRRNITTNVRCLNSWDTDIEVHVGGTGTMCFNTKQFKISLKDFTHKNMADVQLSLVAKQQGVKIMALAHPKGYLQYIDQGNDTIWRKAKDDKIETQLLNEILK